MQKYNVAVLGCGAIFSRHLSAIQNNPEYYHLVGIYDPQSDLQQQYTKTLNVKGYLTEAEVYTDSAVTCVVILTPNNLHYAQAVKALKNKKNVIIEKPATFLAHEITKLETLALENEVNIFGILQVRLNPAVLLTKSVIKHGLLGRVRGVSLIQRWQRPLDYFSGWRGNMASGGGILREFGVHYLDVLQYLIGMPKVISAIFYNTKFMDTDVNDTIYALFDFNQFGGSMEVSIAAEPKNLECTLSITSEQGFLKLGGKSLDEIIAADFLNDKISKQFAALKDEIFSSKGAELATQGASPYHPELYRQIVLDPKRFSLGAMFNVIQLVEDIYAFKY